MKLKYEMSIMIIDGSYIAVPVGDNVDFRGILRLNETSKDIVEILSNDVTKDEITEKLLQKYNASKEDIERSIDKTLKALSDNNLI